MILFGSSRFEYIKRTLILVICLESVLMACESHSAGLLKTLGFVSFDAVLLYRTNNQKFF